MSRLPIWGDFVDLDSTKWTRYAPTPRGFGLNRPEGEFLLAWGRAVAAQVMRSFVATEAEADTFHHAAPESAARVDAIDNGVDVESLALDASSYDVGRSPGASLELGVAI